MGLLALRPTLPKKFLIRFVAGGKSDLTGRPLTGPPTPSEIISFEHSLPYVAMKRLASTLVGRKTLEGRRTGAEIIHSSQISHSLVTWQMCIDQRPWAPRSPVLGTVRWGRRGVGGRRGGRGGYIRAHPVPRCVSGGKHPENQGSAARSSLGHGRLRTPYTERRFFPKTGHFRSRGGRPHSAVVRPGPISQSRKLTTLSVFEEHPHNRHMLFDNCGHGLHNKLLGFAVLGQRCAETNGGWVGARMRYVQAVHCNCLCFQRQ